MSTEEQKRHEVLTAWGKQERPKVLSYAFQQAEYWLLRHDEYLGNHGSYRPMIATPYGGGQALRGWRGLLVIVIPLRTDPPKHWDEVIGMVSNQSGISTWTESLP